MILTEKECEGISKKWFIDHGDDKSEFEGLSLGNVLQLKIFEKIYLQSQVGADNLSFKSLIKRLDLDWIIKIVFSLFSKDKDKKQRDYLFFYDVNNKPMIDALNVLSASLSNDGACVGAITVDRIVSMKCSVENKLTWFGYFSKKDFYNFIKLSYKYCIFIRSLRGRFDKLNITVGSAKSKAIEKYFRFQSFFLILEKFAIESILISKRPKVIVVASDAHRVSRMAVILSKKYNIKTVVYQHGATIWEYGYVPVYADKIMVWGEAPKKWFVDRGVSADKIFISGNILMNSHGLSVKVKRLEENRKLFFFTNPIDRDITKSVIKAIDLICVDKKITGCLKLHPSEKNIDFFQRQAIESSSNLEVSVDTIKNLGIKLGDIAVVINSTAGIDSCLYGAIVFCVDIPGMPNPINYEGGGVGVHSTIKNLSKNFDRIFSFPIEKYAYNRPFFLDREIGNLDGLALQRATDYLLGIMK